MKKSIQGYLRIIASFVRAITTLVIVTPIIQYMICGNDDCLWCGINPADRRNGRVKRHRDADIEFILNLARCVAFGS
jgi:hypothetical protein